ncbi:transposase [Arsukibacterium indicum]|uniref:Transposase n=1 Tax=Arsukibacterium indicum TaxID=2848612 RepID=A0ABS6MP24_9GAMM|nr:transposase [Arsukibacterium indicum]MBV2130587.1 transposase [Arsukibacterium indicum]
MARQPRYRIPGLAQHVVQRGNNKQACFYHDDDYRVYLDRLKLYAEQYGVKIHAFILMTNHVHLLLTPEAENSVSLFIQALGRFYVQYVNKRYDRSGTLWEGRYRATLVDTDNYYLAVSRYIELNPVRALMVDHPAAYPWSSFHANGLGKPIQLWQPHQTYMALGETAEQRQKAYCELFSQDFSAKALAEIRYATQKGWVLGSERFKQQIAKQTSRPVSPRRLR